MVTSPTLQTVGFRAPDAMPAAPQHQLLQRNEHRDRARHQTPTADQRSVTASWTVGTSVLQLQPPVHSGYLTTGRGCASFMATNIRRAFCALYEVTLHIVPFPPPQLQRPWTVVSHTCTADGVLIDQVDQSEGERIGLVCLGVMILTHFISVRRNGRSAMN